MLLIRWAVVNGKRKWWASLVETFLHPSRPSLVSDGSGPGASAAETLHCFNQLVLTDTHGMCWNVYSLMLFFFPSVAMCNSVFIPVVIFHLEDVKGFNICAIWFDSLKWFVLNQLQRLRFPVNPRLNKSDIDPFLAVILCNWTSFFVFWRTHWTHWFAEWKRSESLSWLNWFTDSRIMHQIWHTWVTWVSKHRQIKIWCRFI